MPSDDIYCGTTTSKTVRFVREGTSKTHREMVDVSVTERDWDVTDPAARHAAAIEEVGEFGDDYHVNNVGWYIDRERNAAALCVHRLRGSRSAALVCG